ncbi:hypothetical protein HTZ84_09510 [Haloterrigena sp. SYSU A558-1]|uniref:Uncharacterized protein n=1 Tax=Haloterrigena gelatinilytica TaxID=2741724 RepID=A0ABX2LG17_9EURY|nr:hypothetical protein [Haloterrigena gelatinilytica]NUC72542.1 hypothetical protein [Haloterrigena gelatinilytica]
MVSRKESAADIVVSVGEDFPEVVVESLSVTKNVDIETIYGSGQTLPDGYAINQVSYEGSMSCKGNRQDLDTAFFDDNGIPQVLGSITITHLDGGETAFYDILVTSEGYEVNSGETVETSYEFIAMSKSIGGDKDADPSDATEDGDAEAAE